MFVKRNAQNLQGGVVTGGLPVLLVLSQQLRWAAAQVGSFFPAGRRMAELTAEATTKQKHVVLITNFLSQGWT